MTRKQAIMALVGLPAAALATPPAPQTRAAVIGLPQPQRPAPIVTIGLGEQIPEFTDAAWIAGLTVCHGDQRIFLSADDIWAGLTETPRDAWPGRR